MTVHIKAVMRLRGFRLAGTMSYRTKSLQKVRFLDFVITFDYIMEFYFLVNISQSC